MLPENGLEMSGVAFTNILDAEVVDDEGEYNGAPLVAPQALGGVSLVVALGVETLVRRSLASLPAWGRP